MIQAVKIVKVYPTAIWIEDTIWGERKVMVEHEGCEAFAYATFGYSYLYTSNSGTHAAAHARAAIERIGKDEPSAIAAWNRRAPPEPQQAEPAGEMSEPRIFELALEAGIKHGFIPDDEYRRAMDIEPGTRWTAEEVRPEQTVAFARRIESALRSREQAPEVAALHQRIAELEANGPMVERGKNGNGEPWMGTMRQALEDAIQAAEVEAGFADEWRAKAKELEADKRDLALRLHSALSQQMGEE